MQMPEGSGAVRSSGRILFDQAHVVARAQPVLEAAGVAGRCRIEAGSFFESIPEGAMPM